MFSCLNSQCFCSHFILAHKLIFKPSWWFHWSCCKLKCFWDGIAFWNRNSLYISLLNFLSYILYGPWAMLWYPCKPDECLFFIFEIEISGDVLPLNLIGNEYDNFAHILLRSCKDITGSTKYSTFENIFSKN